MSVEPSERPEFALEKDEAVIARDIERNAAQQSDAAAFDDETFVAKDGSEWNMRTYHNGDSEMLRVFDGQGSAPPDHPRLTPAYANLRYERGDDGTVARTRLNDIFVPPEQRGLGIGSHLLGSVEANAVDHGASEVYGSAPSEVKEREWYQHRGYAFRTGSYGEEVFKAFAP